MASPGNGLERVRLFGLAFVNATMDELVADVLGRTHSPNAETVPVLVTPNVDELVLLQDGDDEIRALYAAAEYVLPDGQPVVLTSRLAGRPLRERLAGSTLFARLWPLLAAANVPVLIVAPSSEVGQLLRREHRGAEVVVAPHFAVDDRAAVDALVAVCLERAIAQTPKFVFVGLGFPRQQRVIAAFLDSWPASLGSAPLCLSVGAAFEMYTGLRPRAPEWMQRIALEWFYRFLREPRRLFHRYFVRDAAFVPLLVREVRASRRRQLSR